VLIAHALSVRQKKYQALNDAACGDWSIDTGLYTPTSAFGHLIKTALAERVAARDAPQRQPAAAHRAKAGNRDLCIL
jgi:hypothetical protein